MKKLVITICLLVASAISAKAADFVESAKLRNLMSKCETVQDEVHCLRRGIQHLIRGGDHADESLICNSNGTSFAVYDEEKKIYLDDFYSKTANECKQTIDGIRNGLICSVGSNAQYAVRDIATKTFISPSYAIPLSECLYSITHMRSHYICIAGPNSKYARYNTKTKSYLDSNYSFELNECINIL
jgi:hypothetical protein